MKVITSYPVYVDNVRESDADLYMSEYPETMSSFDSTKESEVKAFQDWLDANKGNWHPIYGKINKKPLNLYGVYDAQTKRAYETYGKEFDEFVKKLVGNITTFGLPTLGGTTVVPKISQPSVTTTTTTTLDTESKKKEEEEKKRKRTRNIIIASSVGVVVLGLVIYLVTRKK